MNKAASADSSETANPPANGNDGGTATRWCAANALTNHYWLVNLGAKYSITGSEVTWESSGKVYKYKIEVSSDGTTWPATPIVDKTGNTSTSQIQTDTFTASNIQYVRITVTGLDVGAWASFFEFKVFGS